LALVRALPEHSLIDRLVRGRAWIPVLGVLLAGIVAMQVEILKLGSSMGRAMERGSVLQTQNESLQASVAALADDQRIERLAAGMGMSMPTPDSLVFLSAHPNGDIGRALGNIHSPDPAGFMSQLAAQAAAAAALTPTGPATTPGTGSTTTVPAAGIGTGTSAVTPTSPGTTATPAASTSSAPAPTAPAPAPTSQPATPATTAPGTTTPSGANAGATSAGGTASTGAAGIAPAGSSQSQAP
jgi:cell division protein FtsL